MAKRKVPISSRIRDVQSYMESRLGIGVSYDVDFREIMILKQKVQLYYVNGLCDDKIIVQMLRTLIEINDYECEKSKIKEIVQNRLTHEQLEIVDRKSTRLNSSHVSISYAVFCLKKKKKRQ